MIQASIFVFISSIISTTDWILPAAVSAATVILVELLIFLVIRMFKKNKKMVKKEDYLPTASWLEKYMASMPTDAKTKTMFYLYQIDFFDADETNKKASINQQNSILTVCSRLNRVLPGDAKISLRGTTSFVVFIHSNANPKPEEFAEFILKKVRQYAAEIDLHSAINGAVVTYPASGQDSNTLLKNLETALIASRRTSPGSCVFYSDKVANKINADYKYYQDISEAIKAKEFLLYYQPMIDTQNMEVTGGESLIRWKHRKLGVLPPANFLHIMEQTGDINWVGFWCFEEMIRQMIIWFSNYKNRFTLGINISEKQLSTLELSQKLHDIVKKYNGSPSSVVIEIQNFSLYQSSEVAKINIDRLKQYGFKLAWDGFKNAASLKSLSSSPVDIIKMDRSLWKTISEENSKIIDSLIKYCDKFKIMLIAQGVEDKKELEYLNSLGIKHMQGYVFAQPAEPQDFFSCILTSSWRKLLL